MPSNKGSDITPPPPPVKTYRLCHEWEDLLGCCLVLWSFGFMCFLIISYNIYDFNVLEYLLGLAKLGSECGFGYAVITVILPTLYYISCTTVSYGAIIC
ncbi:hypothetical protein B9Z19DRAFT_1089590 [Tuber borchii]|uniref:Uncharacterized protein n=1 Tax=Tuber borchii TaxID=42251 RepID=A0A2T6ZJX3_TUBBO|nr:hypothetical protein B9Z19DRAFT_1089590 [Tuber borchii]